MIQSEADTPAFSPKNSGQSLLLYTLLGVEGVMPYANKTETNDQQHMRRGRKKIKRNFKQEAATLMHHEPTDW